MLVRKLHYKRIDSRRRSIVHLDLSKQKLYEMFIFYYRGIQTRRAAKDFSVRPNAIGFWFQEKNQIPRKHLQAFVRLQPILLERKLEIINKKIAKLEKWKEEINAQHKSYETELRAMLKSYEKGRKIPKEIEEFDLRDRKHRE